MDKAKRTQAIQTLEAQAKELRKLGWTNEAAQAEKMAARNKRRLAREEKKEAEKK
jgi:hypothetical protein